MLARLASPADSTNSCLQKTGGLLVAAPRLIKEDPQKHELPEISFLDTKKSAVTQLTIVTQVLLPGSVPWRYFRDQVAPPSRVIQMSPFRVAIQPWRRSEKAMRMMSAESGIPFDVGTTAVQVCPASAE